MKSLLFTLSVFSVVAVSLSSPSEEKYTDKYDNINLDEILHNDRLLNNYQKCFLGQGKCTPQGEEAKKNLIEALENECAKCTDKQKADAEKILRFLYREKREKFEELSAKYDPEGRYLKKYESLLSVNVSVL